MAWICKGQNLSVNLAINLVQIKLLYHLIPCYPLGFLWNSFSLWWRAMKCETWFRNLEIPCLSDLSLSTIGRSMFWFFVPTVELAQTFNRQWIFKNPFSLSLPYFVHDWQFRQNTSKTNYSLPSDFVHTACSHWIFTLLIWLFFQASPPKVSDQRGQFLFFNCSLKTFGLNIKRWIWDDKSTEIWLLFPDIYI